MPMIAITTSSSTSVKAVRFRLFRREFFINECLFTLILYAADHHPQTGVRGRPEPGPPSPPDTFFELPLPLPRD